MTKSAIGRTHPGTTKPNSVEFRSGLTRLNSTKFQSSPIESNSLEVWTSGACVIVSCCW